MTDLPKCATPGCDRPVPSAKARSCSTECYQANYRAQRREAKRAYAAAYRAKNRDKINAQVADWRRRNPGAYKRWASANAERLRAKDAAWRRANPDKVSEQQKTRRARRAAAPGDGITAEDWAVLLEWADRACVYCGAGGRLTQDHVVPLNRGGAHDVTNIVPACRSCNSSKQDSAVEEWAPDWVAPWWLIADEGRSVK